VLLVPLCANATPLEKVIPSLFGGSLSTTIDQTASDVSQASVVQRFTNLSAQLAAARSQVPLPSSSGAFSYAWDSDVDSFVRFEQSLGAGFGERAQTLGKGRFNVGLSYQHVDFSTLAGDSLDNLVTVQPAFSKSYLAPLPEGDQAIFRDDIVRTQLNMSFTFDMFYLSAAYGLTDTIDVSLALAINHAHMQGNATAMTLDPAGNGGVSAVAQFSENQVGLIKDGTGPICGQGFRCAKASFNESATGTGDVFLRAKWHVVDTWLADIALAEVLTLPTGNADELLGFHDPTFTPWFIASKNIGRVSPHVNLGYSFRSAQDVSQAQWIVGARCADDPLADAGRRLPRLPRRQARRHQRRRRPVGGRLQAQPLGRARPERQLPVPHQHRRHSRRRHLHRSGRVQLLR
jgi:hypothetical protein